MATVTKQFTTGEQMIAATPVSDSFTHHSIVPVFRALSQRKRQGLLSVSASEGEYTVSFYEGRIVAVTRSDESISQAIIQRLFRAGLIPTEIMRAVSNVNLSLAQGYAFLVGKGHVSPENFNRAKSGYELDLVHSLRFLSKPTIHFTPKVIQRDPQLSSEIFPGQVLLDVIELENDEARYDEIFTPNDDQPLLIVKSAEEPRGLIPSERVVWESLDDFMTAEDMFERTLLSVYETKEALLSLYDQKLVNFTAMTEAENPDMSVIPAVLTSGKVAATSASDDVFALAPESKDLLDAAPVEARKKDESKFFSVRRDDAKIELPSSTINETRIVSAPVPLQTNGTAQNIRLALEGDRIVESEDANTACAPVSTNSTVAEKPSTSQAIARPHFRVTPAKCTAWCVFIYLLSLAILAPTAFNGWFDAMRSYLIIE